MWMRRHEVGSPSTVRPEDLEVWEQTSGGELPEETALETGNSWTGMFWFRAMDVTDLSSRQLPLPPCSWEGIFWAKSLLPGILWNTQSCLWNPGPAQSALKLREQSSLQSVPICWHPCWNYLSGREKYAFGEEAKHSGLYGGHKYTFLVCSFVF